MISKLYTAHYHGSRTDHHILSNPWHPRPSDVATNSHVLHNPAFIADFCIRVNYNAKSPVAEPDVPPDPCRAWDIAGE